MKTSLKLKRSILVMTILLSGAVSVAGPGQVGSGGGPAGKVSLNCNTESSLEKCADKIELALVEVGCEVDTSLTECDYGLIQDPNSTNIDARIESDVPVCKISSRNCSSPHQGAWSERCDSDKKMIEIARSKSIDSGFGYGIATMIFGYSRKICIGK